MNKEELLSIAGNYYDEFTSLQTSPSFYDYEKSLAGMLQKMGRDYMEKHLNETSATEDRRKKKR